MPPTHPRLRAAALKSFLAIAASAAGAATSGAQVPRGFLETTTLRHVTLTSSIPDNGDQNPYALVVAPVDSGTVHAGDLLIDNFNNSYNLQGTGTTIMDYNPTTKRTVLFAQVPNTLPGCRPGV